MKLEYESDPESYDQTRMSSFGCRWSMTEDDRLRSSIEGMPSKKMDWNAVSAGIFYGARTPAQCQSRWEKVIKPGLVKGPWTSKEDDVST